MPQNPFGNYLFTIGQSVIAVNLPGVRNVRKRGTVFQRRVYLGFNPPLKEYTVVINGQLIDLPEKWLEAANPLEGFG